jgi:hypothetical protein
MKKWMLSTCLLVTIGFLGTSPALAREAPASKSRKVKSSKAPKAPANSSPAENRSERERRLLRECRGKPNAGACEGHAS